METPQRNYEGNNLHRMNYDPRNTGLEGLLEIADSLKNSVFRINRKIIDGVQYVRQEDGSYSFHLDLTDDPKSYLK